jgi:hypothetical protein
MSRPLSPQTRFLLRASLSFAGLLIVWWFLLIPPLLTWARVSTDMVLNLLPGATVQTGVTVLPGHVWDIQGPVRVAGQVRNVRVQAEERLARQLTVALPLFWAILIAAPHRRGFWRALAIGSAILLILPAIGLIAYTAHIVRIYVFPNAPAAVEAVVGAVDYIASTVAPYIGPVLLALGFHPELRSMILADSPEVRESTPSR